MKHGATRRFERMGADLSKVVVVVRVVHRVVLGPHDRLGITPLKRGSMQARTECMSTRGRKCKTTRPTHQCIVNICRPDAREEQQEDVREVVHRHDEEEDHVGTGLVVRQ